MHKAQPERWKHEHDYLPVVCQKSAELKCQRLPLLIRLMNSMCSRGIVGLPRRFGRDFHR